MILLCERHFDIMAFRITSLVIVGHNSSQNFGVIYYHYSRSLATSLQVIIHKTYGQTERTNQTLEQYLHCFICYQQDDWVDIFISRILHTTIPSTLLIRSLHFLHIYRSSPSMEFLRAFRSPN